MFGRISLLTGLLASLVFSVGAASGADRHGRHDSVADDGIALGARYERAGIRIEIGSPPRHRYHEPRHYRHYPHHRHYPPRHPHHYYRQQFPRHYELAPNYRRDYRVVTPRTRALQQRHAPLHERYHRYRIQQHYRQLDQRYHYRERHGSRW